MQKLFLFIFLGVAFWFNAAMVIRFCGYRVFSLYNPMLIFMFILAIPLTIISLYITKAISGLEYGELLRPVVVMTITATFCDGIALIWFRQLYSQSFEVALYGAAWILWGVGIGLLMALYLEANNKTNKKVLTNEQARDFNIADVYGNNISLKKMLGHKVHLTFYRFSGCPNCNLRLHNIEKLSSVYKENNVVSIAVFESSAKNMRDQMTGYAFYSIMIPDAEGKLYKLYDLDRSKFGLIYYLLFKGGIAELMEGKKLFKQKVEADGHADRLEAEFLINKQGKVVLANYCKRQGDFIETKKIIDFINKPDQ